MKYLVGVETFFPDKPGGAERVAWDFAQIMRNNGNDVTIFCSKQSPDAEDISEYKGIKVVRFAIPKTKSLDPFKMHRQKTAGVAAARKYLGSTHWDLVHIHIPLYGKILYEIFGDSPRYIYTVHSPIVMEQEANWSAQGLTGKIKLLFGKRLLKNLEGSMLRRVDCIHTLSEFTKQAIDKYYGVGNKVTVIPHWCRDGFWRQHSKTEARSKLGWPQDAKMLFSIRRLAPRMGLDIAIKALAPLFKIYPDVIFALAGSGELEVPLKQLTHSLGVTDKVWFLGQVSDDTLKRCYEAADLFILPTRSLECFGLPVLEALAYGLPVISTDAAALPELMGTILPECIVSAGNVEELRQKIQTYIEGKLNMPSHEVLISYVKKNYDRNIISSRIVKLLEGKA